MGKMLIIKSDTFDMMQKKERYTKNGDHRKQVKEKIMSEVTHALRDEWHTYKDATKAVFDEIAYKASDRGYSFNGYETIVSKFGISIATAKRVVRRLKDTGLVFVAYRKNPKGRGAKTPVIFFKSHPNFEHWRSFLQLGELASDTSRDTVCEADELRAAKVSEESSASTYDLPNNYINNNQYSSNLVKYVPKKLQNFGKMFGNSLSDLWLRFNLAVKKLGLKLDKLTKAELGRHVLTVVKDYVENGKATTEEERLKLTYTVAFNYLSELYTQKKPAYKTKVVRKELTPHWFKKEEGKGPENFEPSEEEKSAFQALISQFA